jgi:hypothetical protein
MVLDLTSRVRRRVQGTLRAARQRPLVWRTPHQWAAEDGMYAGNGQVWLYRGLPEQALRDPDVLEQILAAVTATGEREVHLLVHVWEHVPVPPAGTPEPLARFQAASLRRAAPVRRGAVGVRLIPAGTRTGFAEEIWAAVDAALGEAVPDFAAYDADRQLVGAALTQAGAVPLPAAAVGALESWYTLGAPQDALVVERDDHVLVDGGAGLIELVAAGTVTGSTPAAVPAAGPRGAVVVSVRGTLNAGPVLDRASVIYGRRCADPRAPLEVSLRTLPDVSARPLPLRQLAALDETLPCSTRRLVPTHNHVTAAGLAALGVGDPDALGAASGLLAGTGGQGMTEPVLVNPFTGTGVTCLVGEAGAGKSFLAESLAYQAHLAGIGVTYVSCDGRGGDGFARAAGAARWRPDQPGDLDPFRWLDPTDAVTAHGHLIGELDTGLTAVEEAGLLTGFARASQVGAPDLLTVLGLGESTTAVAKVRRAIVRHRAAKLLVADQSPVRAALPRTVWVDLSALAGDPIQAVATATVLAHVRTAGQGPRIVVVDGLPEAAHPALTAQVAAATDDGVALVVTTTSVDVASKLERGGHLFVLAGAGEAGMTMAGVTVTPRTLELLAGPQPDPEAPWPRAATCLYRPPGGRPTTVEVGPWPDDVMAALVGVPAEGWAGRP